MLRFTPRHIYSRLTPFFVAAGSILASLIFGALFFWLVGINPFSAYSAIFMGSFGGLTSILETIAKSTPLILTGLSVMIAFKIKFWNIGAEGQIYIGAIVTILVARYFQGIPPLGLLPIVFISAAIASAIWIMIATLLKTYLRLNEIIVTLMQNYVAILILDYFIYGIWRNEFGFPLARLPKNAYFSALNLGGYLIHIEFFVAAGLAVLFFIVIWKMRWGFVIRVISENPQAAEYAGINIVRQTLYITLISGALAGLAGMFEVTGVQHELKPNFSPGYGYTGILVAWLARLHPLILIVTALLFGGLLVGSEQLQVLQNVPISIVEIFQAIILFAFLGGEFFIHNKIEWKKRG